MTTTLCLCCGREPIRQNVNSFGHRVICRRVCPASTAWHATAEGAEAEWNGRDEQ